MEDICEMTITKINEGDGVLNFLKSAPHYTQDKGIEGLCSQTIMDSLREFRTTKKFSNPYTKRKGNMKNNLPPIFSSNPDLLSSFHSFCLNNLSDLTIEKLQAHFLEDLLPQDFQNEKTLLQHHAEKLGVSIDRSPKCYPEIAGGEGIEYIWGLAKVVYRSKPIAMKKTKKNFRDLVDLVTSRDAPATNFLINRKRSLNKLVTMRSILRRY